jgi:hypothetical protein
MQLADLDYNQAGIPNYAQRSSYFTGKTEKMGKNGISKYRRQHDPSPGIFRLAILPIERLPKSSTFSGSPLSHLGSPNQGEQTCSDSLRCHRESNPP